MGKAVADVTVHLDETLNHARLQEIADEVRGMGGVESVTFHDDKPHFMLVQYDTDRTDATSIHHAVTAKGVHAKLIGM